MVEFPSVLGAVYEPAVNKESKIGQLSYLLCR